MNGLTIKSIYHAMLRTIVKVQASIFFFFCQLMLPGKKSIQNSKTSTKGRQTPTKERQNPKKGRLQTRKKGKGVQGRRS